MPYIIRENWIITFGRKKIVGPFYLVNSSNLPNSEVVQSRDIRQARKFLTRAKANEQLYHYGKDRSEGKVEVIEVP